MRKLFCLLLVLLLCGTACLAEETAAPEKVESLPFAKNTPLMQVTFFKIGVEDSILIQCGGETMLIDCGILPSGQEVVDYLLERGITRIDYAVNTHPHDDHINGFRTLFEKIEVEQFMVCYPLDFNAEMIAAIKSAEANGVPVVEFTENDDLSFGGNIITLYQDPTSKNTNSRSMASHVRFGDCSIMLTADVGAATLESFAKEAGEAIKAQILKLAHHGIDTPNKFFFETVAPEICVLTNYRTSERVQNTLSFLNRHKTPLLSIYQGNIDFYTDGKIWVYIQ